MVSAKTVIGIPVYNEIDYLDETLAALSKVPEQKDILFFISDNGSDDGSYELAEKYAADDNRMHVQRQKDNIGAFANFRYVWEESESDYFMWMGAHDVIDPSYFGQAVKIFDKDKNKELAYVAPLPYAISNGQKLPGEVEKARYSFEDARLTRYLQSVAALANCTLFYSMFRRNYLADSAIQNVISNDHIIISHILWHGQIRYLNAAKYYRRYFKTRRETSDERLTGKKDHILQRRDFIAAYVNDFKSLYKDPGPMQDYLCHKMLHLLEQRYGLKSFDTHQE